MTHSKKPTPPQAVKKPVRHLRHGITCVDDYAWLRDAVWQKALKDPTLLSCDIRQYLEAENAYTEAMMADTRELQNTLFDEMKGRIAEDDQSVPDRDGDYLYYVRYVAGGQHPIFCRQRADDAERAEIVLLDGNSEARGFDYFKIGDCEHSPDHRYCAYCIDTLGSETFTLRIRDLQTGVDLPTAIPDIQAGSVTWAADSRRLVYVKLNDEYRPEWVRLHTLHDDPRNDRTVYREGDESFFLGVGLTRSRRFIVIDAHNHTTSEVHLLDAQRPEHPPLLVHPREADLEYSAEERQGELWIVTNADGCEDYKLCKTSAERPGREHWQDFVVPEAGVLLQDLMVSEHFIVRLETENALPRLAVTEISTGSEHRIAFDEAAYDLDMDPTYDYHSPILRFTYSSMTTPTCTYDYDMRTRKRVLLKQDEIPSGHRPDDYITERLHAPTADGNTVPITLLRRKDRPPHTPAPLLLYGYGSYGYSVPARFSSNRLSLVNRGFVYAAAHIRGGMEKGYAWYRCGKRHQKMNTFNDFITAADYLIKQAYTRNGDIAIHGGSAGGMLIGAVLNQRPDLFKAAVADVPFVDVLNTICDAALPLTPPEWDEWGNPIENLKDFEYIRSYSPYDNVSARDYPDLLVTAGVSDPRVTYWEPAKWVAKLRSLKTDDKRLLLKTNMSAGHAGAAGRFDYLREIALMYAFILSAFDAAEDVNSA